MKPELSSVRSSASICSNFLLAYVRNVSHLHRKRCWHLLWFYLSMTTDIKLLFFFFPEASWERQFTKAARWTRHTSWEGRHIQYCLDGTGSEGQIWAKQWSNFWVQGILINQKWNWRLPAFSQCRFCGTLHHSLSWYHWELLDVYYTTFFFFLSTIRMQIPRILTWFSLKLLYTWWNY